MIDVIELMFMSVKCDTAALLEWKQLAYLLRLLMVDLNSEIPEIRPNSLKHCKLEKNLKRFKITYIG